MGATSVRRHRRATRPPIAFTMGDAAGVGPEIIAMLLADPGLEPRPLVIGDVGVMRRVVDSLALPLHVEVLARPEQATGRAGLIEVLETRPPLDSPPAGRVDPACGRAAFDYVRAAVDLALAERISAIVTAPIHKEALAAADAPYPGHTEMLADLAGGADVAMMLANDALRVVLVTIHCSLRDAIVRADGHAQDRAIRLAAQGARAFGVDAPRIAVAGLNPHAGEGGLFGREEIEIIAPAIERARAWGGDVSGPWPGDTVFMQARMGRFDVVVAQYHDQGLIPIKYMGLEAGVNVTLGLPFIRTSPDHGAAFDIAGQGAANPASLRTALAQAMRLIAVREAA